MAENDSSLSNEGPSYTPFGGCHEMVKRTTCTSLIQPKLVPLNENK